MSGRPPHDPTDPVPPPGPTDAPPAGRRHDYLAIRARGQDILTASLATAYESYRRFLDQAAVAGTDAGEVKAFQAACLAHLKHIEELMKIVEPYAARPAPGAAATDTADMQTLLETCRRSLAETSVPAAALAATEAAGDRSAAAMDRADDRTD